MIIYFIHLSLISSSPSLSSTHRKQISFAMWNIMANSMQFFSRISSHRHCTVSTFSWRPFCYRSASSPLLSFTCEIHSPRYWMLALRRVHVMSPLLMSPLLVLRRAMRAKTTKTSVQEEQPLAARKVTATPRPWHGLRWSISYLACSPSCCWHIWVCYSIFHPATSSNSRRARASFRGNITWRNGSNWSFSVTLLSPFGLLFI